MDEFRTFVSVKVTELGKGPDEGASWVSWVLGWVT